MYRKITGSALTVVFLMLTACTMGPAYVRPDTAPPQAWNGVENAALKKGAWPEQTWWKTFSVPDLDALMETAVTRNFDIKAAVARVDQARSLERIAGANLFPGISAGFGAGLDKTGSGKATASHSLNATLSYELDIWGKNSSLNEAAAAARLGSIYDMRSVVVTLTTEVASLYFKALALNDRHEILGKTVEDEARLLVIMEKRRQLGDISGLELAQASQYLASLRAQVPQVEQQRKLAEHGLALLTCRNLGEVGVAGSLAMVTIPATIPVGIPSGLLERRPDIRKAEADLMAANADIGTAKAALFPAIRLTMKGGYAGEELLKLINPANAFYSIGGDILATVFNREKLTAEHDRTTARQQELLFNYRKAVLSAFREVADALIALQKLEEQEQLLDGSLTLAERAYTISEIRYRQGLTDFTTLLTADKSRLEARNNRLQTRLDRLGAMTSLYKALGGGWS